MGKIFGNLWMLAVCLFACGALSAQNVTNITAEQVEKKIHVSYDLDRQADITLLLSINGGKTFSELHRVSGDMGRNIPAGHRTIIWDVLSERERLVGADFVFKVKTEAREQQHANGGDFYYNNIFHVVKNCESLTMISRKYDMSVSALLKLNPDHLKSTMLHSGERLLVGQTKVYIPKLAPVSADTPQKDTLFYHYPCRILNLNIFSCLIFKILKIKKLYQEINHFPRQHFTLFFNFF